MHSRRLPPSGSVSATTLVAVLALWALAAPAHAQTAGDPEQAGVDPLWGGVVAAEMAWKRITDDRPFAVSVAVGAAFGIGGWEDRSFSSASSYRDVRHSVLGGFAADVTVTWQVSAVIAPVLRFGFGGGAFTFDQPGFGPTAGFDPGFAATKETRYGHFNAGFGARFTAPLLRSFRVHATVGMLLIVPFDEVFTFRDSASSEQEWVVHHAPGPGAFFVVAAEYDVSPVVALQLRVHVDVGATHWTRLERKTGSGNYAPTGSNTFAGTVRYESGDFADESPAGNNFEIRRHASADGGVDGLIGAWGITLAVVVRFG